MMHGTTNIKHSSKMVLVQFGSTKIPSGLYCRCFGSENNTC